MGWLTEAEVARIRKLIERAGLPVTPPPGLDAARLRELMAVDKKVIEGQLRLVLLRRIGEAVVTADFPPELLMATLEEAA